jgi:hypothetical protein
MTIPVARSGRTSVLSSFEIATILLRWPTFHQIAETIPYVNDESTPFGGRSPDYPKSIVLLLGVLARVERSLPKAEVLIRPTDQWKLICQIWSGAWKDGIVPEGQPADLPAKPITSGQWRYASSLLCASPDAFARFEDAFIESALELALSLGYFSEGSLTNPDITSCLFADGTEIRARTRSYIEERVDTETGEVRLAAIDPGRGGCVRSWLEETPKEWVSIDPVTGRVSTRLPVDREALRTGKYEGNDNAFNVTPMSVRSADANSRVTLWIGLDKSANDEAATILRGVQRLQSGVLRSRIHGLITDKIIRGKHMTVLYQQYGIIPITKVAVKSVTIMPLDETEDRPSIRRDVLLDASLKKGKMVKSFHLGVKSHEVRGGTCRHIIDLIDGKVVEVDFDESGTKLMAIAELPVIQVKRARRVRETKPYHFNVRFQVRCPHGDFDFWLCPHESQAGDDGRKLAENFRIFPEGTPVYSKLYGSARNTSEGGNAHQKDHLPHKRSQATGAVAVQLEALLFHLAENAKTWYFQRGYLTVDPLLHGDDGVSGCADLAG